MKHYLYTAILSSFILFGCGDIANDSTSEDIIQESVNDSITPIIESETTIQDVIDPINSVVSTPKKDYQEFHETGELKIEGNFDENEERHGLWVSYYEGGIKWSESNYSHGKRLGHSITFFPNGRVRYVGEYADDKQIGHWTFYNEEGDVVNEEDH